MEAGLADTLQKILIELHELNKKLDAMLFTSPVGVKGLNVFESGGMY